MMFTLIYLDFYIFLLETSDILMLGNILDHNMLILVTQMAPLYHI